MLINNYYRGGTDRISGFVYDTEKKTYKNYVMTSDKWTDVKITVGGKIIKTKKGFKVPVEISYYFSTKQEMEMMLNLLKTLGFREDPAINLDFGIFTL